MVDCIYIHGFLIVVVQIMINVIITYSISTNGIKTTGSYDLSVIMHVRHRVSRLYCLLNEIS